MLRSPSHSHQSNRRVHRNRNQRRWFGTPEILEARTLLSTFSWVSAVDGKFNDSNMWIDTHANHGVPGAGDDAVTPNGAYTITVSNSTTVNSLNNGGSLTVTGGTFSVNNTLNAATSTVNNLTVDAGASFHSGGTMTTLFGGAVIAGNLDVSAGATLVLDGTSINLDTGNTMTGAGTFTIIAGVSVNAPTTAPHRTVLDSGNAIGLTGTATFTVPSGSTFDWRGGYMTGAGGVTAIASGATLALDGTGSKHLIDRALNNAGTGTWVGTGGWDLEKSAVFANSGTFTIQNDQSLATGTGDAGSIVNTGTWTKTSPSGTGTTDITGIPFNNTGGTVVAQTGVLQLDNAGTNTGTFNVPTAAGTLWLTGTGYSLNAGTTFTGAGTVHFTTGFFGATLINLNSDVTVPNLAIDNGKITGPGALTVPGTFSITHGTLSGSGAVNIPSGATLTIAGTSSAEFDTRTVNDAGTTTLSGSENFLLANGATFNNSGSFMIQNDTSGNSGEFTFIGAGSFINTGTLTKTSASSTGSTTIGSGNFTNSGTVNVASGQLLFDVIGTSTGTFNVASGALLSFAQTWNLNAGTAFTGPGTVAMGIGFFGYGTLKVNASVSAASFTEPGGTLQTTGVFTVNSLSWSGGTIAGTGSVSIPSSAAFNIGGASGKTLNTVTIDNAGVTTWTGPSDIFFENGATFVNLAGGTFNAQNDQTASGSPTFNNSGSFNKTSISGTGTTTISGTLNNLTGGTVNVASGVLATTASMTNQGTISLAPASLLNVSGKFTQPNAGTLSVAVGGTPASKLFGQVKVTSGGSASLNGTLDVTLANGFTPSAGQTFPVMTYGSRSGDFTTTNLPISGGSTLFVTDPKATEYDLTAPPPPSQPAAPVLLDADDSGSKGDEITDVASAHLTGTTEANATVQLLNSANTVVATTTADASGNYIVPLPGSPLSAGSYVFSVVASNVHSSSPASNLLSLTIVAPPATPSAPTLLPADSNGSPGGETTYLTSPSLTGTTSAGATVQLLNSSGTIVNTTHANNAGSYQVLVPGPLGAGSYTFKIDVIDSNGDVSSPSVAQTIVVVSPPPPPLVTMIKVQEVTNKKHQVTEVFVTFSGAVSATGVDGLGTYRLATAGKKGSYTAKNAGIIKLRSAAYDAAHDTVALTLKKPFSLTKAAQLLVNGLAPSGVQDSFGRLIDGDHNGTAGGNAIAILSKNGATINAVELVRTHSRPTTTGAVIDAVLARNEMAGLSRFRHGRHRATSNRLAPRDFGVNVDLLAKR